MSTTLFQLSVYKLSIGDPDNIHLTGLSAGEMGQNFDVELLLMGYTGAHSVHQILHHVSRLPEGQKAPFRSARLESNAIM